MDAPIAFCCPACRGPLKQWTGAFACAACGRDYPIVCGIPDFRLAPDPYIPFAEEYEKARRLDAAASDRTFEALTRFYWEMTPDVPPDAAERYIRHALTGEARGVAALATIDRLAGGRWTGRRCLEIGCGTGGFVAAAGRRFEIVLGADIALRWLVVARKRLADRRGRAVLVCCSAERLPFADGAFDTVVGLHMLEHTSDRRAVLAETVRVLEPGGLCFFTTPNRLSLGPEPCVRLWGVGFLPRQLAAGYVRLMKGVPYRHISLLSHFELGRLLSRSGLRTWSVSAGRLAECELAGLSRLGRALAASYDALCRAPAVGRLAGLVGPVLDAVGRR